MTTTYDLKGSESYRSVPPVAQGPDDPDTVDKPDAQLCILVSRSFLIHGVMFDIMTGGFVITYFIQEILKII